ncbi:MAG: LacI family DNA-binding transcriptional regulator [Candidatus Cryptobacteroides sp.]
MAKQIKIKDIAKMAGVSAGTVDRILHNRGNVSQASRAAVEKVLEKVDYKYNIHTSAISLRKEYKIVISIPTAGTGEYWGAVQNGFEHALEEYRDIKIICRFSFYNQFDIYSCRSAFEGIPDENPDAVIIGPTFKEETIALCTILDRKGIPYIFVDSRIDGTNPIATYTTDQYACGYLLGKILKALAPEGSEIAIFGTRRIGNRRANNSQERRKGFIAYMDSIGQADNIKETFFSAVSPEENDGNIPDFLQENPAVKGIAVMNSRGYVIADLLKSKGINDICIVSFDLTGNNRRCLEDGSIAALLCQKPELQGFYAIKTVIRYLLYKNGSHQEHHLMPIDIVMKENLPYYREMFEG